MVATRDNQTAAAVMGVNLATIKTIMFGISAAIAGIAGSLYALKLTLVEPGRPDVRADRFDHASSSPWWSAARPRSGVRSSVRMFYMFVNDYARDDRREPVEQLLVRLVRRRRTKINGLGGIVFGVLLILFARFVPFGAVGTMRMGRSKIVQVIPTPPTTEGRCGRRWRTDYGDDAGIGNLDTSNESDQQREIDHRCHTTTKGDT